MTDEAKALVERLRETKPVYDCNTKKHSYDVYRNHDGIEAADLIETQAREIGRLRLALGLIAVFGPEAVAALARQALAGDSHDQ